MMGQLKYTAIFAILGLSTGCDRSVPSETVVISQGNPNILGVPIQEKSNTSVPEFAFEKIRVGDTLGVMEVVSILPYSDDEITPDNFKIQLKGKVKLVGKYDVADNSNDDSRVPGTVSFEPNKESLAFLPLVKPANNTWFILVHVAPGQFSATRGQATILIDNFLICSYSSDEVCNYADLVELLVATPE